MRTRLPQNAEDALTKRILAQVRAVNALIISDYDKGGMIDAERVLEACVRRKVPVFYQAEMVAADSVSQRPQW